MTDNNIDLLGNGRAIMAMPVRDDEAIVNVTHAGQNFNLPDPVTRDATDQQVRGWATEAIRNGTVAGLAADVAANFDDYVIERMPPNDQRPHALIMLRPKVPFGHREKVRLEDIDFDGALNSARALVSVLENAGFRAPELAQLTLNHAAEHVSAVARALHLQPR